MNRISCVLWIAAEDWSCPHQYLQSRPRSAWMVCHCKEGGRGKIEKKRSKVDL